MGLYTQWKRVTGGLDRPDLMALAKKLLDYLDNQRRLSGVKTMTIERSAPDGSVVRASFYGDQPQVQIIVAEGIELELVNLRTRAYLRIHFQQVAGPFADAFIAVDLDNYAIPSHAASLLQAVRKAAINKPVGYWDCQDTTLADTLLHGKPCGNGQSPPTQLDATFFSQHVLVPDAHSAFDESALYVQPKLDLFGGASPFLFSNADWVALYGQSMFTGLCSGLVVDVERQRALLWCVPHAVDVVVSQSLWVIDIKTSTLHAKALLEDAVDASDVPTGHAYATNITLPAGYNSPRLFDAYDVQVSRHDGSILVLGQFRAAALPTQWACLVLDPDTLVQTRLIVINASNALGIINQQMEQSPDGKTLYFLDTTGISSGTSHVRSWDYVNSTWGPYWLSLTGGGGLIVGHASRYLLVATQVGGWHILVLDARTLLEVRRFAAPPALLILPTPGVTFPGRSPDDALFYFIDDQSGILKPTLGVYSTHDGRFVASFNPLDALPHDAYHNVYSYALTGMRQVAIRT